MAPSTIGGRTTNPTRKLVRREPSGRGESPRCTRATLRIARASIATTATMSSWVNIAHILWPGES
jgi:hypothetical protein